MSWTGCQELSITSKALVHKGIGLLHASVLNQQSALPLHDTSGRLGKGRQPATGTVIL